MACLRRFAVRHAVGFTFLVVAPILWWMPLLTGKLPDFMDTVTQLYPMQMAAARQIREGTLPLWMPNIFCGAPLAANPQISTWYAPQFLFYLVPNPVGNGLVVVFHYIFGGLGAYFLTWRLTARREAALFAGFTFQFSAMLVSRVALTPHLYTVVWVPWMFLAIEHGVRWRGWSPSPGALALAWLWAMQVFAGSPQITFYTALALPVYWLVRAAMTAGGGFAARIGHAMVQGVYAAALGTMLAAVQLIPALEYLGETERSALEVDVIREQGLSGSLVWRSFVGYTGHPIEHTDTINAIGWGALLLAGLGLFRARMRPAALGFVAVGVLGLVLSLSVLVPLWATMLPLYQGFHSPRRALTLWSIVGPPLAGCGAGVLCLYMRRWGLPRVASWLALVLLSTGTFWMLPRLDRVFTGEERFSPNEDYIARIGSDRFLAIDPVMNYSYDSRRPDYGLSMMPDLACWFDYHDPQGYDPLVLRRYGMVRRLVGFETGYIFPSHGVFLTNPSSPALRLLNVQYLVGRYDRYNPGRVVGMQLWNPASLDGQVELIYGHARWPLYRYTEERPFAWTVNELLEAPSAADALLRASGGNPFRVAHTEMPVALPAYASPPRVEARWIDGRTVEGALSFPPAAMTAVCVSVSWMPGWTARDAAGNELLTIPVNGFMVGVLVPAGADSFTLRYEPASFRIGFLLSCAGLLFWLGLLARSRRWTAAGGAQS